MAIGELRALWRFPVKSMAGESLDAAYVSDAGIVGDYIAGFRVKKERSRPSQE